MVSINRGPAEVSVPYEHQYHRQVHENSLNYLHLVRVPLALAYVPGSDREDEFSHMEAYDG